MSIEAMKQALEALASYMSATDDEEDAKAHNLMVKAFFELKQAIEQAQKKEPVAHWSDCAVHSEPAYPKGECDCGGYAPPQRQPEQEPVAYTGNGTAGREADVKPTGFFFQADKKQEPVGGVSEFECRRLLFGFMLDCNALGLFEAAENLHKGMKQAAHGIKGEA